MVMMDYTYWFPEGFRLADDLLAASQTATAIELDRPHRSIVSSLLLKCHRLMAASLISIRSGYAVEVEGNVRTIQETLIALKYLLTNPDRHVQMWQDFVPLANWKNLEDNVSAQRLYMEVVSQRFPPGSEELKKAITDYESACDELERYRSRYEEACRKRQGWIKILRAESSIPENKQKWSMTWSLKSNYEMSAETDLAFSYLYMYNTLSTLTHASVLSHSKYQSTQGGLWLSPSPHKLRQSLLALIIFHIQVVQAVANYYNNDEAIRMCDEVEGQLRQLQEIGAFKETNPLFIDDARGISQ